MTLDQKTIKKVKKTFEHEDGCLKSLGTMNASQYAALIDREIESMNTKQRALSKLGVEIGEVSEIEPLHISGCNQVSSDRWVLIADGIWYTSQAHDTWLFFSESRVLWYKMIINMKTGAVTEQTQEFSYKDVTSVSSSSTNWEKKIRKKVETHTVDEFAMKVYGEAYRATIYGNPNIEPQLKAMKNKIREKKE